MKFSVVRICVVAFLVAVLCIPMRSPVQAQQGPCATQIGTLKPDLIVDQALLGSQMFLSEENFGNSTCTVKENCVTSPGKHLLLRFNGSTANIGQADLVIGNPGNCGSLFIFDDCHQHYHFQQFAYYRVWTSAGYDTWLANRNLNVSADDGINAQLINLALTNNQLIVTRKQGFCITDDTQYLSTAGPATYQNCDTTQGLSVGWEDQYPPQLPCQFIQLDGLVDGDYVLEMHVNPDLIIPESDFTNNTGAVKFHFTPKHGSVGPSIQLLQ
jgi:hypothetical protein